MSGRTPEEAGRIVESLGSAEKLVQLIINFPDHLSHNRPGVVRDGKWKAAMRKEIQAHKTSGRVRGGEFREPGPRVEAIEQVYSKTVQALARMVGYKPRSERFFEVLGWKRELSSTRSCQ